MGVGDIQVAYAGMRMSWRAVSDRGRAWAERHADDFPLAPEGEECLTRFGDDVLAEALIDGLVVMAGELEVSLC